MLFNCDVFNVKQFLAVYGLFIKVNQFYNMLLLDCNFK